MLYARRAIAVLIGFATGFIATATVAYASLTVGDSAGVPADAPGFSSHFPGGETAVPQTTAADLPLWQFLAFVALTVLLAVAIVGLGHSLSRSRRSQQPLAH